MGETTVEPPRTLTLDEVAASFETHAGLRCTRVGEDGDVLILGHHDEAAIWAAFAYYGDESVTSGPIWYDLHRTQVAWSNHSEGCELVDCACEKDNVCEGCRAGKHDACKPFCECQADYDHDRPEVWPCSCECYCDEYAWWVSDVKTNGEPATWVRWSDTKARARREARPTTPPVSHEANEVGA